MLLRLHVKAKQEKKLLFKKRVRGWSMISWCHLCKRAEESADYLQIQCLVIWELGVVVFDVLSISSFLGASSEWAWLS